jgi:hypothetical protein
MQKINTENIYKYLQPGLFEKSSRFSENQADLRNLGAFQKIRRI